MYFFDFPRIAVKQDAITSEVDFSLSQVLSLHLFEAATIISSSACNFSLLPSPSSLLVLRMQSFVASYLLTSYHFMFTFSREDSLEALQTLILDPSQIKFLPPLSTFPFPSLVLFLLQSSSAPLYISLFLCCFFLLFQFPPDQ